MSANPVTPIEDSAEGYQESLTERLGRGRLPLAETLRYAAQIAAHLRELHSQRLVYGAVSSQLILLGPAGATLRSNGALAHLGDARGDVTGFGTVLSEMVRKTDGPQHLCDELNALAVRCQDETPDMQQVAITLRLLALAARQGGTPVSKPVLLPPLRKTAPAPKARLRLHFSLHWRPLVNLVAAAFPNK